MLIAYLQQATHSVNTFVPWLKYLQVHLIFHCLLEFQDVIYAQRKIGKKQVLFNEKWPFLFLICYPIKFLCKNLHTKKKALKSWPHLIVGKKAEELGNESTKLDKFLERFVMVVFWPDQGVL